MASTPQIVPVAKRKSIARRLITWAAIGILVLIVLFAVAVTNNNYSFRTTPRAEFNARVDRAIDSSTNWIVQHPEIQGNPSLMYMVGDMAAMSGDARLQQFITNYLASNRVRVVGRPITWYYARLADPRAPVPILRSADSGVSWELLWDTYATAPDHMELTPAEHADMFSTKYIWGRRNHQLLALDIYLHYNGLSPELERTIRPAAEGVAGDEFWDFRVTDAYVQRSAFVLGAERPELIKSRWIERILDYQHPDGSWSYCWYGWCRGVFEFSLGEEDPGHSTVQAAWALYMLKYRYPQWIDQHYHSS